MLYIGCHLSSSKGFAAMGRQAPCGTCWPGTASAPSSPTLPIL